MAAKPLIFDTSELAKYLWIGRNDLDWYSECQNTFVELFGEQNLRQTCQIFAATSINSSLKSNIRLFQRARHELENDLPFGKYLPNIKLQLERIRRGEDLSGRKINNFANAMSGDIDAVVVDIWILRAFKLNKVYMRNTGVHAGKEREGGASKRTYDAIEEYIQTEARQMGLQPRQFCAMLWSGIRTHQTGKTNPTRYSEILRHRFRETLFD